MQQDPIEASKLAPIGMAEIEGCRDFKIMLPREMGVRVEMKVANF